MDLASPSTNPTYSSPVTTSPTTTTTTTTLATTTSPSSTPSRYENQKRRDLNTFCQYLRNHRPPLSLPMCSGAHVLEFLRYIDQFGKTKVHNQTCPFFGLPNPPAPCPCPLRQAWGALDALIGRLRAAYEEQHGGRPEGNPFGAKAVRIYLREVRDFQAKATGLSYMKKRKGPKLQDDLKSGLTGAISASAQEQNNVDMAQQQEPLLTGIEPANDFTGAGIEPANDLTGAGIELPRDTPDDQQPLFLALDSVHHVDRIVPPTIDENYNRREATERLVQPGVGASSFGVCGNHNAISTSQQEQNNDVDNVAGDAGTTPAAETAHAPGRSLEAYLLEDARQAGEDEELLEQRRKGIEMAGSNIDRSWNHVEQMNDGGNSTHKTMGKRRKRIEMAPLKSGWTGAQEQNNVDMAQQREPLLTGEFERANNLTGAGIELPPDTPDDQEPLLFIPLEEPLVKMLRQNDQFWDFVEKMDGGCWRCSFCGQLFSKRTGIMRIKLHLAGEKGRGVRVCGQVPRDVQLIALAAIDGPPKKKLKTGAGSSNNEVTNAISASAQEQNNVDMAQQREPFFAGEFEWISDLIGKGIELQRDTPATSPITEQANPETEFAAIDGPPEKKLETGAGSSNNEVTHPPKNLFCPGLGSYSDQLCSSSVKHHVDMDEVKSVVKEKIEHDVIMDDVKNVVKVKTEHDVMMDEVKSVVKEKIEPIASMLEQSNAILNKSPGDDGRIQVGLQSLEQGAEEELMCLHPEANSGRLVQPDTSASSAKLASRASVKNAIWSCLMDDKVSIIGIYGMGGNGKTTMLRNICNELLERQDISHSIYWVNVPQDFRIDRSQDLIAKRLDLNLPSKDDDLCGVVELAKELMMKQKWILILNDLWNSFDPQELGIPIPLNGSKFIMTTRSKMVCQQMNCQNSIRVDPLSDEEAWTLFMEKLGHDRQLSQEEKGIAEDAARECAGLPLGIVTLAESLKGVHELHKWKITLKRLKESNFWEMEDQIFQILRLSYDCLDDSAKQCFVYCALFDESQKIERGELIESFIEEGIIKEFDKGHSILDSLENVCLLERIDDGSAVKMHDLLRDMAIQILADEYSLDMAKEERG